MTKQKMPKCLTGLLGMAVVLAPAFRAIHAGPRPGADAAARILDQTGLKGGLIVHVGCGDGKLTAALRANESFLVHGLDKDPENVTRARRYVRSLGLYGPVTIDRLSDKRLPYADDLVNLVVVDDSPAVSMSEIMRVLAPKGMACTRKGGKWSTITKPWPEEIDQWTHYLHDASNNAVAQDTRVGPPRRLRWVCGPLWARSHEFNSSLCAMVSAGGRLFYIFDEGLTGITTPSVSEKWTLIARDAFNGVLLWKRPMPDWGSTSWRKRALRAIPATVPRRLVAQGQRLFVTLGYDAPVSVLDGATGQLLATYPDTEPAHEIRCLDRTLILRKGPNIVMALDTDTGRKLWQASGKIQPLSLTALAGRVFYQAGTELFCRAVRTGDVLWQVPTAAAAALVIADDRCILLVGAKGIQAFAADTGKTIWTVPQRPPRGELFIARGRVWHWQGSGIVGRDLQTGKLSTTIDPSEVFTPGHHPRCYQSKCTIEYLITPERGAEFISLTGGAHTQNDWTRGPCKYGVMPANGLLYVPPNPCFCYPGVKVTGFNAFAGADRTLPKRRVSLTGRLERSTAYKRAGRLADSVRLGAADWPTYRHDSRRTGAAGCQVDAKLARLWQLKLPAPLTPAVAAGRRLYVAAKDQHTLYALAADDGRILWQFTAGGRIDSPATLHGGLVLFGSTDGCVYCLDAENGQLAWRFRAAPTEQRIVAFGRLESPWPVHGSILVEKGLAYCTAGRSSYLDGGIFVYALEPATGKVVHHARVDSWARTREDARGKPFIPGYHMEGTHSDILVSQGGYIYMGQVKFDLQLDRQQVPYVMPGPNDTTVAMNLAGQPYVLEDAEPQHDYEKHQRDWLERTQKDLVARLRRAFGGLSLGQRLMGLHLIPTGGFLDDSWFNRTYWMYSRTWPGFYLANRAPKTGQLLVIGPRRTYAVQAFPSRNLQSPLFTPGEKGYLLLADRNENEPVLDHRTRETTKGWGYLRAEPPVWYQWVPVRIRAMVLAGAHLFVAGPPDVVDPADPMAAFEGRKGGLLRAVGAETGDTLAEYELESPPVFDGLIAAADKLYLCTLDGSVICMAARGP